MDAKFNSPGLQLGPFQFFETSDGHKVHYRKVGSPTAPNKVVFVMGLMGVLRGWYRQIDHFLERGSDFECVFLDNRGMRFSDGPPGPYSTQVMARDVVELMEKGVEWERYAVVGISMGGMIAQHVALLGGEERVTALVLLCTRAQSSWWSRCPAMSALWNFVYRYCFIDTKDAKSHAQMTVDLLFTPSYLAVGERRKELEEKFYSFVVDQLPHRGAYSAQLAAVRGHELTDQECQTIKEAKYPVGAFTGDCDRLIHYTNSLAMEDLLGAEVKIAEGCDHGILEESPELNSWIDHFLSRAASSSSPSSSSSSSSSSSLPQGAKM